MIRCAACVLSKFQGTHFTGEEKKKEIHACRPRPAAKVSFPLPAPRRAGARTPEKPREREGTGEETIGDIHRRRGSRTASGLWGGKERVTREGRQVAILGGLHRCLLDRRAPLFSPLIADRVPFRFWAIVFLTSS